VKLTIVPEAIDDLRDATSFYARQVNAELARQFVDEFERVTNLISSARISEQFFAGTGADIFFVSSLTV
jgi:plasmid stabilization system protein ParE